MGSLLLGDGHGAWAASAKPGTGCGGLGQSAGVGCPSPVCVEMHAWRTCSLLWPLASSAPHRLGGVTGWLAGWRYIISLQQFFFFFSFFSGVMGKVGDSPGWELSQGMGLGALRPHSDPTLERGLCCSILSLYVLDLDLCPSSQLCVVPAEPPVFHGWSWPGTGPCWTFCHPHWC